MGSMLPLLCANRKLDSGNGPNSKIPASDPLIISFMLIIELKLRSLVYFSARLQLVGPQVVTSPVFTSAHRRVMLISQGTLMSIDNSLFQRPFCQLLMCMLCMTVSVGCGGSSGTQRVSARGSVRVDSEPLKNGTINFKPAEGHQGPAANGAIVDGKFFVPAAEGPLPGPYVVSINLTPDKMARTASPASGSSQPVKTKWEINVDVDSKGLNEVFELSSGSK